MRLPPEDPIRIKQAEEILIICFYCKCILQYVYKKLNFYKFCLDFNSTFCVTSLDDSNF